MLRREVGIAQSVRVGCDRSVPLTLDRRCESQATLVCSALSFSYATGESIPSELCRRVRLENTSIQSKIALESTTRVFHFCVFEKIMEDELRRAKLMPTPNGSVVDLEAFIEDRSQGDTRPVGCSVVV